MSVFDNDERFSKVSSFERGKLGQVDAVPSGWFFIARVQLSAQAQAKKEGKNFGKSWALSGLKTEPEAAVI